MLGSNAVGGRGLYKRASYREVHSSELIPITKIQLHLQPLAAFHQLNTKQDFTFTCIVYASLVLCREGL